MVKKKEENLAKQIAELKEQMSILTEAIKTLTAAVEGKKKTRKKEVEWTEEQLDQRKAFKAMIEVGRMLKDVYNYGMMVKAKRDKVKPRDMFKTINKSCFRKGEVKWENLQLSYGSVSTVKIKGAEMEGDGKVRVRYESTGSGLMEGDEVWICTVSEDPLKKCLRKAKMSDGEGVFMVPKEWKGGKLHIYAFAYSSEENKFSKTTYWGMEKND